MEAIRRATGAPGPLPIGTKARLLSEVFGAYAIARRDIGRTDLRTTLASLRGGAPNESRSPDALVRAESARLGRVVHRVLGRLPVRAPCLLQSLTLTRLLARRGVASTMVIGVRPGLEFGAHAWVEVAGQPLLPPGGTEFERLVEL